MSTLSDRIAAEHLHWPGMERCRCGVELVERGCGCNEATDAYTRHVVEVTEAAVRAQIEASLEDSIREDAAAPKTTLAGTWQYQHGKTAALLIVKGAV